MLAGGYDSGGLLQVEKSARIDASGAGNEKGGRVTISANNVYLGGTVDVSGAKGGVASINSRETLLMAGTVHATGENGGVSLLGGKGIVGLFTSARIVISGGKKPTIKAKKIYRISN